MRKQVILILIFFANCTLYSQTDIQFENLNNIKSKTNRAIRRVIQSNKTQFNIPMVFDSVDISNGVTCTKEFCPLFYVNERYILMDDLIDLNIKNSPYKYCISYIGKIQINNQVNSYLFYFKGSNVEWSVYLDYLLLVNVKKNVVKSVAKVYKEYSDNFGSVHKITSKFEKDKIIISSSRAHYDQIPFTGETKNTGYIILEETGYLKGEK